MPSHHLFYVYSLRIRAIEVSAEDHISYDNLFSLAHALHCLGVDSSFRKS